MNMFEKASKLKLRFASGKGLVSIEDLWDFPLEHSNGVALDNLAQSLNKQLKESGEESFVREKSTENTTLQLKFDIVKYIIDTKLANKERAEKAALTRSKRQRLEQLRDKKVNEQDEQLGVDEIDKLLAELED